MHYCPYCGADVKEDEHFCLKCGKQLPGDIENRQKGMKRFNRYWYFPMLAATLVTLCLITYNLYLENKGNQAKELYELGESYILEKNYEDAREQLTEALKYKSNFYDAEVALKFINNVLHIENELTEALAFRDNQQFNDALAIVNDAENIIKNYHGVAVTQMITRINESRNDIKLVQLKNQLDETPSIDQLKTLLWDAESIKTDEATDISLDIKKQIVDYTFSRASETLNNKQFNDALLLVEDGLKYASDSERLQSLKTTIDKEQTAFEIAEQQRIEQAIHIAAKEYDLNTLDAIKLNYVKVSLNEQDKLVVKGEVTSVATIPINSILIEYSLLNQKDSEILTNKVFVFPDKLYPDEKGRFEFTHYDVNSKLKDIKVEVKKITWYTD